MSSLRSCQQLGFSCTRRMFGRAARPSRHTQPKVSGACLGHVGFSTTAGGKDQAEESKYKVDLPFAGLGHMGEIRNMNKETDHTAYKPDVEITIGDLKKQGYEVARPVREYYKPEHWKYGRSHLIVSLEFDQMHAWFRPPAGKPFPPSPLATLSPEEQREKWPFFVPMLQKMVVYEDDWVMTDVHTLWSKTPVWVTTGFQRFLGVTLHPEGTPEYDALISDLDKAELKEDEAGWVGPQYFRAVLQKYEGQKNFDQAQDAGVVEEDDHDSHYEAAKRSHDTLVSEAERLEKEAEMEDGDKDKTSDSEAGEETKKD